MNPLDYDGGDWTSTVMDRSDISALLNAADALKRRSPKPNNVVLRVLVNVMRSAAQKIARGEYPVLR